MEYTGLDCSSLAAQAALGRGLWIGLFSPTPIVAGGWTVVDPHCTVLHLGRVGDDAPWWTDAHLVRHAAETCASVATARTTFSSRVGGLARFASWDDEGNPAVMLLSDQRVRWVRDLAVLTLSALTRTPHEHFSRYDYTPHVTLGRVPRGDSWTIPPTAAWPTVDWAHLAATCGDARLRWPLTPPTA